jgi:hypothetical protein
VQALAHAGALEACTRAEALRRQGRARDAAEAYARAATAALEAGLRAAAVRYVAAAHPGSGASAPSAGVSAALEAIATALGPAVQIESLDKPETSGSRARVLDPEALEQAAAQFDSRDDTDAAARLRALAELARGNAQRALRLADAGRTEGSSKSQLTVALTQAAAGELPRAVRTTLAALAQSRRSGEAGGEAAALALLSALYRASGRDDDARILAEGARRAQGG